MKVSLPVFNSDALIASGRSESFFRLEGEPGEAYQTLDLLFVGRGLDLALQSYCIVSNDALS
jgi:hypothetical protein